MAEKVVWKYEITPRREFYHLMPEGAQLLYVGAQGDSLCIWALYELDRPMERRGFLMLATGDSYGSELIGPHIGTFIEPEFKYVFHVFEQSKEAQK